MIIDAQWNRSEASKTRFGTEKYVTDLKAQYFSI